MSFFKEFKLKIKLVYYAKTVTCSLHQAPEIMISKPYNPRISDLWSLGSVLYVMVMGRLPYGRIEDEVEVKSLGQVQFPDPQVLVLSNEMKELIQGMLAYVPSVRCVKLSQSF